MILHCFSLFLTVFADDFWLISSSYNQPTTLMLADASKGPRGPQESLKSLPAMYDASKVTVQQFFATSADGTQVPYFQVGPETITKPTPTLLYGYGGFEISLTPVYGNYTTSMWLWILIWLWVYLAVDLDLAVGLSPQRNDI